MLKKEVVELVQGMSLEGLGLTQSLSSSGSSSSEELELGVKAHENQTKLKREVEAAVAVRSAAENQMESSPQMPKGAAMPDLFLEFSSLSSDPEEVKEAQHTELIVPKQSSASTRNVSLSRASSRAEVVDSAEVACSAGEVSQPDSCPPTRSTTSLIECTPGDSVDSETFSEEQESLECKASDAGKGERVHMNTSQDEIAFDPASSAAALEQQTLTHNIPSQRQTFFERLRTPFKRQKKTESPGGLDGPEDVVSINHAVKEKTGGQSERRDPVPQCHYLQKGSNNDQDLLLREHKSRAGKSTWLPVEKRWTELLDSVTILMEYERYFSHQSHLCC